MVRTFRRRWLFVPLNLLALLSPAFSQNPREAMPGPTGPRYVVSAFGAVADGTTLNTAAIQQAIDTAEKAGGGVVEIPPGTFRSGSIFLKPGVELHLAAGAVLLGSTQIADNPHRVSLRAVAHGPRERAADGSRAHQRPGHPRRLRRRASGSGGRRTRNAPTSRWSVRG